MKEGRVMRHLDLPPTEQEDQELWMELEEELMEWEQEQERQAEAQVGRELLTTDPIATYQGFLGKVKIGLTYFVNAPSLQRGRFKETFTIKEATFLKMGKEPQTIINGRVPRAYCLDEISEHFGCTEEEFMDRVGRIARLRGQVQ